MSKTPRNLPPVTKGKNATRETLIMDRRAFLGGLLAASGLIAGSARARPTRRLTIQESVVAGFQYHQGPALIDRLAPGQPIELVREAHNRFDPRAVRLDWHGHKLGYLPRNENAAVAQMLDRGERLTATVSQRRARANPWERLAVRVECTV
jgi:hypothetical protein